MVTKKSDLYIKILKARINIKPSLKNILRVYLNLKSEKVIKIKNMKE
ncbi:hypothetical protein OLP47_08745 [Campylobacter jejuni]|nr:hypothetical protein [Campylobacter jejuni]